MMKLIPEHILQNIPNLYETEDIKDPICQVKLFTPDADWTWYVIEYSKENKDICYGLVKGLEAELGYFSLKELEKIKGSFGLPIERDFSFKPIKLSKVKEKL
ncbi:hypothetical protein CPG38_13540 [Malaciobacter marinus]|nr:hypothetical protein CPG38_13540 [Malaciobacter marinus]